MEEVEADLREGRAVITCFPLEPDLRFKDALRRRMVDVYQAMSWEGIDLAELKDENRQPARLMHLRFDPKASRSSVFDASSVADCQALWGNVVCIESVPSNEWDNWMGFLRQYLQISRNREPFERTAFFFPLGGPDRQMLPEGDVALSIRSWEHRLDLLDSTLFAAHICERQPAAAVLKKTRVAMISELAGPDPEAALLLANLDIKDLFVPTEFLHDLADSRGWPCDGSDPTWTEGSLDYFDGRPFVHSAFLAHNGDKHRELDRRIWRAQLATLFPLIEEQRIRLIDDVKTMLTLPVETEYAVLRDPLDLEIAQIAFQLSQRSPRPREYQRARKLARMRNALAHLEPLGIDEIHLDVLTNKE